MTRFGYPLLVIATFTVIGCAGGGSSQPAGNAARDTAGIDKVRSDFMTAWAAGDAQAVANLYTDDAVIFPENQPTASGRTAIAQFNKASFEKLDAPKMVVTPEETKVFADWAFDRGTFVLTATAKVGGAPIRQTGRYLVLMQKQSDGSWKLARDMDNSGVPLSPPPAAQ